MHKTILNAASALLAVAISGSLFTTTTEAKVVVVQVGSPVLAAGSSYAWAPASGTVIGQTDPMLANEVTGARLGIAIESVLAGHGYRRADASPSADFAVSFRVVLQQQQETRVIDNSVTFCGWRGCVRRWPTSAVVTTQDYTQGTLVIDLRDRRTGALVWRGASEKRVTTRDVSQARLNAIVADMMKSLPAN